MRPPMRCLNSTADNSTTMVGYRNSTSRSIEALMYSSPMKSSRLEM